MGKYKLGQTVRIKKRNGKYDVGNIEDYVTSSREYLVLTDFWHEKDWYKEDDLDTCLMCAKTPL